MATIMGDSADNLLNGGPENDLIQGLGGHDELSGGDGDDTLIGGEGEDYLRGGRGSDHFVGNAPGVNADELDRVFYHVDTGITQGVDVDLALGRGTDGWGYLDTYEDIYRVTGTHLNDTIRGDHEDNSLSGMVGNDLLDGRGGWDFVRYAEATGGVTVDLAAGTSAGAEDSDTLISIEGVGGSNFSDWIYGSDRTDVEEWFYLDDFGNETTPNYQVEADDFLDGRGGLDGIAYDQNDGRVTINLQKDRAIDASGHVDTLLNVEMARGSQADDRITGAEREANRLFGSAGNDWISGLSGRDYLNGSYGNDRLQGDAGQDELLGGAGEDQLWGGAGRDLLEGGKGADAFIFTRSGDSGPSPQRSDRIVDFTRGEDRIVLTRVDAVAGRSGNQDFRLDQGGAFEAGEIQQHRGQAGLRLAINLDGDARAELSILLQGFTGQLRVPDFDL